MHCSLSFPLFYFVYYLIMSFLKIFEGVIPSLYNQIKLHMPHDGEKPPLVYGLGSVYSASIVASCLVLSILICLLLNDGAAPSILCASISFYLILEMYSVVIWNKPKQGTSEGE